MSAATALPLKSKKHPLIKRLKVIPLGENTCSLLMKAIVLPCIFRTELSVIHAANATVGSEYWLHPLIILDAVGNHILKEPVNPAGSA